MHRLNDDCLYDLFKVMPLADQLMMARVCARFRNIIKRILKLKYNSLELSNLEFKSDTPLFNLNATNIATLLNLVACKLKRLDILDPAEEYACLNNIFFYSELNFENVVELNVTGLHITDDHVELFAQKCKQLDTFSVCSPQVTGRPIAKMEKLKNLRWHYCFVERNGLREMEPRNDEESYKTSTVQNIELTNNRASIITFQNLHYFEMFINSHLYKELVLMSFTSLILHIIENCRQLVNFETIFYERRFPINDIVRIIEELNQKNRSIRLVFYSIRMRIFDDVQTLVNTTNYNQQNKFKIEFKYFEEQDFKQDSYVRVYLFESLTSRQYSNPNPTEQRQLQEMYDLI